MLTNKDRRWCWSSIIDIGAGVQGGPGLPYPTVGVVPPARPNVFGTGDPAAAGLDAKAISPAPPAVTGTDGGPVSLSTSSDDSVCDVLDIDPANVEGMCAWLLWMFVTSHYYNFQGTP